MIITNFNIGDKVHCTDNGNGKVVHIGHHTMFPVHVEFEGSCVEYTVNGSPTIGGTVTLTKVDE